MIQSYAIDRSKGIAQIVLTRTHSSGLLEDTLAQLSSDPDFADDIKLLVDITDLPIDKASDLDGLAISIIKKIRSMPSGLKAVIVDSPIESRVRLSKEAGEDPFDTVEIFTRKGEALTYLQGSFDQAG